MPGKAYSYKIFIIFFVPILFFLLFLGCVKDISDRNSIYLWTSWQNEIPVLTEVANAFYKDSGIKVNIINIPFTDLTNKFQLAAPSYVGPDLITGPNDWAGPFATANLISPLLKPEYFTGILNVAQKSMEFDGTLFGFPLFMEGVALIYNQDIIFTPPNTMKDLLMTSQNLKHNNIYGLVFDVTNFYFSWPIFKGWNASIFIIQEKETTPKVALSLPPAIKAAQYIKDLVVKDALFPATITGDVANALFLEKKAAMIINGPWFIEDIRRHQINFGIASIPLLPNGMQPSPFVGVQGIFLNKRTKKTKEATAFIEYISKPEIIAKIAKVSGRIPVNKKAIEILKDDPIITNFSKILSNGTPLPNSPAMTQVWPYMSEGMKLLLQRDNDVSTVMEKVSNQINAAIERLLE